MKILKQENIFFIPPETLMYQEKQRQKAKSCPLVRKVITEAATLVDPSKFLFLEFIEKKVKSIAPGYFDPRVIDYIIEKISHIHAKEGLAKYKEESSRIYLNMRTPMHDDSVV